jgi:ATP-dependent Clp protease ATP-binding subunit ClpA
MSGCDAVSVFERFTERARQVVVLAQAEARELRFSHIGTEALLLGLLHEEEGLAARVLESFGITVKHQASSGKAKLRPSIVVNMPASGDDDQPTRQERRPRNCAEPLLEPRLAC